MWISELKVNGRMITKANVKICGRQYSENGKYVIARAPNWKDV